MFLIPYMNRMPKIAMYLGVFPQGRIVLFNIPRGLEHQSPSLSMNQEYCKEEDRISLKKNICLSIIDVVLQYFKNYFHNLYVKEKDIHLEVCWHTQSFGM